MWSDLLFWVKIVRGDGVEWFISREISCVGYGRDVEDLI